MEALANYFLGKNKVNPVDYTEKYRQYIIMENENSGEGGPESPVEEFATEESRPEMADDKIVPSPVAEEAAKPEESPKKGERVENQGETTVMCPRCGAPMVRRMASKGANAGKEFYGCSNFPKCRKILSVEEN